MWVLLLLFLDSEGCSLPSLCEGVMNEVSLGVGGMWSIFGETKRKRRRHVGGRFIHSLASDKIACILSLQRDAR